MKGAVFLAAAAEDDVGELLALERRCFSHPWSARNFADAITTGAGTQVLTLRGLPDPGEPPPLVAYCVYQAVLDEVQVHNLAVAPERRGQGLARTLLRLLFGMAHRRGAASVFLEVRQGNVPALELYRSLGFRTVGLRRDYYTGPREDALVLRKDDLAALNCGRGRC